MSHFFDIILAMTIFKKIATVTLILSAIVSAEPAGTLRISADSYSDMLNQQQVLTAKINQNRSDIQDLTTQIGSLTQKINTFKANNGAQARAIQVNNPAQSVVSVILSSKNLSEAIQNIANINLLIDSSNQELVNFENSRTQKQQALSQLNLAQVSLDQQNQQLTNSLNAYNAAVAEKKAAEPTFTTKSEQTQTSQSSSTSASSSKPATAKPAAPTTPAPSISVSEAQARANIVYRESRGDYTAQNGRYYGAYQLDISYLHGDLSPANQDRTAQAYVVGRYGSWANAWAFWQTHHWY